MLESIGAHILRNDNLLVKGKQVKDLKFRGTPGGTLTLLVSVERGPDLGDTVLRTPRNISERFNIMRMDKTVVPSRRITRQTSPTRPFLERSAKESQMRKKLLEAIESSPALDSTGDDGIGVSLREINPNQTSHMSIDGRGNLLVMTDDLRNPTPPPDLPQLPFEVSFSVENGPVFHRQTIQAGGGRSRERRIEPDQAFRFSGHDVIVVTIINPNDFALNVRAHIHVQNDLTISTTIVPKTLLERTFNDTLLGLAPSFGIEQGKLFFSLGAHVLGIPPFPTVDIGLPVDASVNIQPIKLELLTQVDAIEMLVREMEEEIRDFTERNPEHPELMEGPMPTVPSDFATKTVDAYFNFRDLTSLFKEMKLFHTQWTLPLMKRPLLHNFKEPEKTNNRGRRHDVALKIRLGVTDIAAGADRLQIDVESVVAELYVVLTNGNKPTQFSELEDLHPNLLDRIHPDFVRSGYIVPRYNITVDIKNIDVELELSLAEKILTTPTGWLIEHGLQRVADWLKNDLEKFAVKEVMDRLDEFKLEIGNYATEIMSYIANRNHLFRRLRADNRGWIIDTLDLAQLAVPFIPPDPVDHRFDNFADKANPIVPIDGPMPADARERLQQVKHLVFLMMENRSFDNMLGYLSHPEHGNRQDVDGLDLKARIVDHEGNKSVPQPAGDAGLRFHPNPEHGSRSIGEQINDGAMNGFVPEFEAKIVKKKLGGNLRDSARILSFYTADQVTTYDVLSKCSLILDRWFSAVPAGTYPNRSCYYTGKTPSLENKDIAIDAGYQTDLTLFDVLDHAGVEWTLYENNFNFLRMYEKYRLDTTRIRPFKELKGNDVQNTVLPPVTFIDPRFKGVPSGEEINDDHAPTHIGNGQKFIAELIEKLQHSPSWPETMLVIIYDENGGFADHVPPPGTSASEFPSVALAHPKAKNFGVRVPSLVVSPLVPEGQVGHQIYDHSTVFRTIVERFAPEFIDSVILPERVRQARHLGELINPDPNPNPKRINFTSIPGTSAQETGDTAFIHHDGNGFRPSKGKDEGDPDDIHYHMRRLGNPIRD